MSQRLEVVARCTNKGQLLVAKICRMLDLTLLLGHYTKHFYHVTLHTICFWGLLNTNNNIKNKQSEKEAISELLLK